MQLLGTEQSTAYCFSVSYKQSGGATNDMLVSLNDCIILIRIEHRDEGSLPSASTNINQKHTTMNEILTTLAQLVVMVGGLIITVAGIVMLETKNKFWAKTISFLIFISGLIVAMLGIIWRLNTIQ